MARGQQDLPFDEWRQEQEKLEKLPVGGQVSPIAPGYGLSSHPPRTTHPGSPAGGPTGQSKYNTGGGDQPPSFIDDVDSELNWFSPMQPITPFGPPYVNQPREWDYQTGYNLNFIPNRMNMFGMLRAMRSSWGVLATIISTRQDQLLRVPWTIQKRQNPRSGSVAVDEMKKFFRKPDGKHSYSQWTRMITDDLLVIDAPTIYFPKNRAGKPMYAERLDGASIFPLIDDMGRRPDYPQPAFQQIIKGMPLVNLDETEIMYVPMRPRAEYPVFGYSPAEQILVEVTEAIRKSFYQMNFWSEGTIPDLIVTVPKDWNPRQIAMFQAHFDAMLSGNLTLKSKVRFLPGDMKPFDIKNSSGESLWSPRDEHLIRLACYSYSVSPAPFIQMMNRSTAQSAQQTSVEEGLYPLMAYWKDDIMDPILQDRFGYEDIEFVFQPIPEANAEKQSKIHQVQVHNAIRPINEIRVNDLGLEPIPGGDVPLFVIGNAIIPLTDAAAGLALPQAGGDGSTEGKPNEPPSAKSGEKPNSPIRGASRPRTDSPVPSLGKISSSEVDDAAADADGDVDSHSAARLSAGNYPKGHVRIHGLDISIENAIHSTRGKKNTDESVRWKSRMPAHYGYIRGTLGADGDHVDVYIGRRPDLDSCWVIDQTRLSRKGKVKFDEHKVMLGYKTLRKALKDYVSTRDDGKDRIGAVVELSVDELKSWLKNGNTTLPIAGQVGKTVSEDLFKADTISASTGLANNYAAPRRRKRRKASGPCWLSLNANL